MDLPITEPGIRIRKKWLRIRNTGIRNEKYFGSVFNLLVKEAKIKVYRVIRIRNKGMRIRNPGKQDKGCSVCCRRRLYFLHTFSWLCNCFGIFFILAAHEHYSIGKEDELYFQLSLTVKIVKKIVTFLW